MRKYYSSLLRNSILILLIIFTITSAMGQNLRKEKMAQLDFLIGDWVGVSASFENGIKKQEIPAFEKIAYQLDGHIITIDLKSESLQLHTVIYFDDKDNTYFYNPFYTTGTAKYAAEIKDGKLIVNASSTKRFIFRLTPEGHFQEYGEQFINGEWQKYFEDNFKKI